MSNPYLGPNERQGWLKPNLVEVYTSLLCNISGDHDWDLPLPDNQERPEEIADCEDYTYGHTCQRCGVCETVTIPGNGEHDWTTRSEHNTNGEYHACTDTMWIWTYCSKCGGSDGNSPETIEPVGHQYDNSSGLYRCIYCGELSPGDTAI